MNKHLSVLSGLYAEASLNQMVYENGLIQKGTYEKVCQELRIQIDRMEQICYNNEQIIQKAGCGYGFIEDKKRV